MFCSNVKRVVINLSFFFSVAAVAYASPPVPRDTIEVLRADLKADRNAVIAQEMILTEQESRAFWPIYREYRNASGKVTDRLVELVLEYADLYPNVPEAKAHDMLNQYTKVEAELLGVKRKYLKKMGKTLPASKLFRFAQLENRFELGTRLAVAAWLPMLSTGAPNTKP